jgi:hypothetical protein
MMIRAAGTVVIGLALLVLIVIAAWSDRNPYE